MSDASLPEDIQAEDSLRGVNELGQDELHGGAMKGTNLALVPSQRWVTRLNRLSLPTDCSMRARRRIEDAREVPWQACRPHR